MNLTPSMKAALSQLAEAPNGETAGECPGGNARVRDALIARGLIETITYRVGPETDTAPFSRWYRITPKGRMAVCAPAPAPAPASAEAPAPRAPAPPAPAAADFIMHIGGCFYTPETFTAEAAALGISRRIRLPMPRGLTLGQSRIWCVFGAPAAESADYRDATIHGWFTPERIEFIAGPDGRAAWIEASLLLPADATIIGSIEAEPERGCGRRRLGGTYLVVDRAHSPYHEIDGGWTFRGAHHMGLRALTPVQAETLRAAYAARSTADLDLRTEDQKGRWTLLAAEAAVKDGRHYLDQIEARDPRLPPAGTVLMRATRKHGNLTMTVHEIDIEYAGRRYRTLSGAVKAATGTPWNGYAFFGLTAAAPDGAAAPAAE